MGSGRGGTGSGQQRALSQAREHPRSFSLGPEVTPALTQRGSPRQQHQARQGEEPGLGTPSQGAGAVPGEASLGNCSLYVHSLTCFGLQLFAALAIQHPP